jgi:hypothetical protein
VTHGVGPSELVTSSIFAASTLTCPRWFACTLSITIANESKLPTAHDQIRNRSQRAVLGFVSDVGDTPHDLGRNGGLSIHFDPHQK